MKALNQALLVAALSFGLAACQNESANTTTATNTEQPAEQQSSAAPAEQELALTMYKSPRCGCCDKWAEHMQSAGFSVTSVNEPQINGLKSQLGVDDELRSCHTATIEHAGRQYVIEGHVPAEDVLRLLEEQPEATGLAVPGMPIGSPGMEMGDRVDPYAVVLFDENMRRVYARHPEGASGRSGSSM